MTAAQSGRAGWTKGCPFAQPRQQQPHRPQGDTREAEAGFYFWTISMLLVASPAARGEGGQGPPGAHRPARRVRSPLGAKDRKRQRPRDPLGLEGPGQQPSGRRPSSREAPRDARDSRRPGSRGSHCGADGQGSCALASGVTPAEAGPRRPAEGSVREGEGATPSRPGRRPPSAGVPEKPTRWRGVRRGRAVMGRGAPRTPPQTTRTLPEPVLGRRGHPAFPAHQSSQAPVVHLALSPAPTSRNAAPPRSTASPGRGGTG